MHDRLTLYGHVHGHPERTICSYFSWPEGVDSEELQQTIQGFTIAFTPIRYEGTFDGVDGVWYFKH